MNKTPGTGTKIVIAFLTIGSLALAVLFFNIKNCCGTANIFPTATLGQFGDFYSGCIGTIITFFGLYFIYRTYILQNNQLDIAKKNSDLEIVNKLYSELLQEINSIQFRRKVKDTNGGFVDAKGELFLGIDALYNFDKNHWHSPNSVLNHLNSIMVSFDQLIFMTENRFMYKHKETKNILLTKIYFLFYSKITWPVYQEIYQNGKEELLRAHPDSPPLFKLYERLTKKSYDYLLKGEHIGISTDPQMMDLLNK